MARGAQARCLELCARHVIAVTFDSRPAIIAAPSGSASARILADQSVFCALAAGAARSSPLHFVIHAVWLRGASAPGTPPILAHLSAALFLHCAPSTPSMLSSTVLSIACLPLPNQATSALRPCPSATPSPLPTHSPRTCESPSFDASTSFNGSYTSSKSLPSSLAAALYLGRLPPSALARKSSYFRLAPLPRVPRTRSHATCALHSHHIPVPPLKPSTTPADIFATLISTRTPPPPGLPCLRQRRNEVSLSSRASPCPAPPARVLSTFILP
ncbi:hypothetical protein DFH07DRAFT_774528 [Mycena maculata]|uniref:Uncharacterized protein n=1 Tax=Mycena maculata TaxID=230809 RepID=A0AAD7IWW9_9AGAR|nr:hypothetical protein DFH07DRAFT_774528 [Mycena maculata]